MIEFKDSRARNIHNCLKAVSKDGIKQTLMRASVQNNVMRCTDGTRLHWLNLGDDTPDGLYDIIVNKAKHVVISPCTEDLVYPDIDNFLPIKFSSELRTGGDCSQVYSDMVYHCATRTQGKPHQLRINLKFLDDAIAHLIDCDIVKFQLEACERIVFGDKDRGAIIMPIMAVE